MYGVPPNLPVQRFVGDSLFQVCIGMDGVHFVFGRAGTISVEGRWELHDAAGRLVDESQDHANRDSYRIHAILNEDVVDCSIDPPRSFTLSFASGYRLTVYDDSPQYESFAIHPDGIIV